ncbi:MAG: family 16 glycosylhydrolase [Flavobacteriaceae bacterium]|nr:family 16 glycosylhydrolase [Flavobacteriaceae bacterium]
MKKTICLSILLLVSFIGVAQNIAFQKPVSVSSLESSIQMGQNAVDGDLTTRWASDYSDPQSLTIDLNANYTIDRVVIHWEDSFGKDYQIQLSSNNQQWTTVANITNGNGGMDTHTFTAQSARYVRMYGTQRNTINGAQYGYSIYEFEVYGIVEPNNALLSNISINNISLSAFTSNQFTYNYVLDPGVVSIPTVQVTPANTNATYSIQHAQTLPGSTRITVTSADQTATQDYVINFQSSTYTLTWNDEFNYEGAVNPLKWHHQTYPPNNGGWFNNEEQHYTDKLANSYVSNGSLKIKAIKEDYEDPDTGSIKPYSSARLNSKYAFKYGRMEVRAKLSPEIGTWPAFWTLGKNITERGAYWETLGYGDTSWPACGEIDIMEQDANKSITSGAFHFPNENGIHTYTTNHISVNDTANTWHIYAMEWSESTIKIMVDGVVFHTLNNAENPYFDNEHFILLNIAMGGDLGGGIPSSFTSSVTEIDYVRVYQLETLTTPQVEKPRRGVTLYPNPTKSLIHITTDFSFAKLYDLSGKLQKEFRTKTTDLSLLSKGVYLLEFYDEQYDRMDVIKVVKE